MVTFAMLDLECEKDSCRNECPCDTLQCTEFIIRPLSLFKAPALDCVGMMGTSWTVHVQYGAKVKQF